MHSYKKAAHKRSFLLNIIINRHQRKSYVLISNEHMILYEYILLKK